MASPSPVPTDDVEHKILADVARVGWAVLGVPDDDEGPGFAFSIGLHHSYRHPELIVVGLPWETSYALVNNAGAMIKTGARFDAGGTNGDLLDGFTTAFIEIARRHYQDYLGSAEWYYGGAEFPAVQIVWPDRRGFFPWDAEASPEFRRRQPLLDGRPPADDWPFDQPPNAVAVSLRRIVDRQSPILYVTHDEDDHGWQFLDGGDVEPADAAVVCMAEVLTLDPTVREVADLPPGGRAWRSAPGEPWEREKRPRNEES
ncbi:MAG: DUF4262 domain-containing protein [Planctomycetia bacterium]